MSAEQVTSQYPLLLGLKINEDCSLDISNIIDDIETSEMLEQISDEPISTDRSLSSLKALYMTALTALFDNIRDFLTTVAGPEVADEKIFNSCKPIIDENYERMVELGIINLFPEMFAVGGKEKPITLESLKKEKKPVQAVVIFQKLFTRYLQEALKTNTLPMYQQKISALGAQDPLIAMIKIEEDASVSITEQNNFDSLESEEYVNILVNSLSNAFNSLVDLSSFILGSKKAFDEAKDLINPIISEYSEISENLGIYHKILKGALSDRVTSGVDNFDDMIFGGFPRRSSVIIQGPFGGEKEMFCNQFVKEGLIKGGAVLVVLSRISPDEFRNQLKDIGVELEEYENKGLIKIVDWYSWKTESIIGVERESNSVLKASRDLSSVGIALGKAIEELAYAPVTRGFVEMLSPAMKDFDFEVVYDFSQSLRAKFRKNDITGLFLVEKKMHDVESLSALHQIFDGVVDIVRFRDDKDKLTEKVVRKIAVSMIGTRFEPGFEHLSVTKDGLSVIDKQLLE